MTMKDLFQKNIYGMWRQGEKVSYMMENEETVRISVETAGKTISFTVQVHNPCGEAKAKLHGEGTSIICIP